MNFPRSLFTLAQKVIFSEGKKRDRGGGWGGGGGGNGLIKIRKIRSIVLYQETSI